MNITSIHSQNNCWVPKETSLTAIGVAIAATSNLTVQFFQSSPRYWMNCPTIVKNFVNYSCGAGAVAGTVIAVYSIVHLCQKMISEKNVLYKAVTATALGVSLTALVEAIGEHFWTIAPRFNYLMGHSMMYCIGTNLAWQICAITGVAGIVFTVYAAHRIGKAVLSPMQKPIIQ